MLKRIIGLPYNEARKVRARQKVGTMKEYYDEEKYLCYDEKELKNYKPKKRGRPSKRRK